MCITSHGHIHLHSWRYFTNLYLNDFSTFPDIPFLTEKYKLGSFSLFSHGAGEAEGILPSVFENLNTLLKVKWSCAPLRKNVSYRASLKTWHRPWFVHSWLFSIRKFKIQINILNEYSFRSNILFVSSKMIVYFWRYDFFPKNPCNSFFPRHGWQFYAS